MIDLELPEIPLEEVSQDSVSQDELKDESGGCLLYSFIGTGQGGGRLAEAFYKLGYKKTLCTNTAKQDLDSLSLPDEQKIHFDVGENGAGKDMRVGEAAADKNQQMLYELMLKKFGKVDHIFVCVGAGGGSGGGSTLVLVQTAKKFLTYLGLDDVDLRVGVIMSLPTNGECASPTVASNAKFLVDVISDYAERKLISPFVIVDNDKIKKLYPQLTVKDFWPTVNNTIAGLFHVFNVIPNKETPYTTFDAADYGSVMRAGGCMVMGVTAVKDFKNVSAALKSNLEKTLLADSFDLRTASHAAAIVVGGKSILESVPGLMSSLESGFDTLAVITGKATVHRGVYEDSKDKLCVYTLINGLSAPTKRIESIKRFEEKKSDIKEVKESNENIKMPSPSFNNKLYNE